VSTSFILKIERGRYWDTAHLRQMRHRFAVDEQRRPGLLGGNKIQLATKSMEDRPDDEDQAAL
jgi:hypothetical protein